MKIKKIKIIILLFSLIFFNSCIEINYFDNFIIDYVESVLYKNKTLFKSILLNKQEFRILDENRFSGNYESYINFNTRIFNNGIKNIVHKNYYIQKINKGKIVNSYGLKLIFSTKIYLKDENEVNYHMRILYIIKIDNNYKIFMINKI